MPMATTRSGNWANVEALPVSFPERSCSTMIRTLKRAPKSKVRMRRVAPSTTSVPAFFASGGLQSAFGEGRPASGGSLRPASGGSLRPASGGSLRPTSGGSLRPQSSQSMPQRPSSGLSLRSDTSRGRPVSAGSVCSAPADLWLSGANHRGMSASQWRWHGKHGRPEMNPVKVAGAPWLPPDPTGVGSNVDMGNGMLKSLRSRRANKMAALKYKMTAAAYGGEGPEHATLAKLRRKLAAAEAHRDNCDDDTDPLRRQKLTAAADTVAKQVAEAEEAAAAAGSEGAPQSWAEIFTHYDSDGSGPPTNLLSSFFATISLSTFFIVNPG